MSVPRFQSIETLRTLAALCIALYHFLLFSDGTHALFTGFEASAPFFELLRTAVLVFFVVTAIVIPVNCEQAGYTLKNYPRFLLRRLIRVHIPFLVVIALTVLQQQAFLIFNGKAMEIDSFRFLANITLTAEFFNVEWYNTIFWTLAIEMQFYMVIGLFFPLIRKYGLAAVTVFFCLGEAIQLCSPDTRFLWFYTPFFTSGLVLWLWYAKRIPMPVVFAATVITSLAAAALHEQISVWIAVITPLAVMLLKNRSSALSRMGKYTYIFYLIHGISGGSLLYFTRSWGSDTPVAVVRLLLAFGSAFLISWLFYRLVEKPSIQLTHKVKYKR